MGGAMYLFGDVRTRPSLCKRLAVLIDYGLITQGKVGDVSQDPLQIALIGLCGSVESAQEEIGLNSKNPWDITTATARALGFQSNEEEIVLRALRWNLVEGLPAKEISERLHTATT